MTAGNSAPVDDSRGKPDVGGAMVRVLDYDPGWPQAFEREAERIRSALGRHALSVEHVGSTAVPGLAAKPVIDILLVVANSAAESDYRAAVESAGFVLRAREPEWFEHRFFDKTPAGSNVGINLHVFSAGCPEIQRMLAFRDHLRAHAEDRELYARVKRELAQRPWRDIEEYAQAKNTVVDTIHSRIDTGA
ncbi:GrpB family protein [Prauserella sp. PE36]|uniref:GrpB family protein n=1 Tax=Prauserella sp. PE36 TaxID=1504709 RepID=UPI001F192209|nr:GrpB family protein [Prauserella sp. PE36]